MSPPSPAACITAAGEHFADIIEPHPRWQELMGQLEAATEIGNPIDQVFDARDGFRSFAEEIPDIVTQGVREQKRARRRERWAASRINPKNWF